MICERVGDTLAITAQTSHEEAWLLEHLNHKFSLVENDWPKQNRYLSVILEPDLSSVFKEEDTEEKIEKDE